MSSRSTRVLLMVALSAALALILAYGCDKYEVQQPVNNPPSAPSNPSPVDDASSVVDDLMPTLTWEGGEDADQDAVVFDIVLGTEEPYEKIGSTDENTYEIDVDHRLAGDAVVTWQVIARDSRGAAAAGPQWAFRTTPDMNSPPTAFSSPVPADGDTGIAVDVLLQWFGGEDPEGAPVTYIARIDTVDDFIGDALQIDSTLTDQRYRPREELLANTTYYWQVTAIDTVDASTAGPTWSFSTGGGPSADNDPPNPVGGPLPGNSAIDVAVTLSSLRWAGGGDPDGDPVTYEVHVGIGEDLELIGTSTQKRLELSAVLEFSSVYNWRVDSADDHGNLTTGVIWSFSTEVNDPPTDLTDPTPADGATDQTADVTLAWQGGTDPEGLEIEYLVYISEAGGALQLLDSTTRLFVSGASNGPLTHGMQHVWRVDARDSEGLVTTGPEWSFTTVPNEPPTAPELPTPVDGQTNVAVNSALTWGGAVDPEGDQLHFEVRLGTSTPPAAVDTVEQASFSPGANFAYLTNYFWQIVAWDEIGNTVEGPIWSFATASSAAPSVPCAPVTPADAATGVGSSVGLTWGCGEDPEGDPVTYEVLMGTALPLTDAIATGLTSRSHPLSGLPPHTTYYWQVRVTDGLTSPVSGPVWSFTTYNTAPNMVDDPDPIDTAVDVSVNATLGWGAAVDGDGDDLSYRVFVDPFSPPSTQVGTSNDTTIVPGTMVESTVHYWQVIAEDAYGGATPGPVWRFTTGLAENNPPNAAVAPSPADAATDVAVDAALTWIGSDPDEDDLTYDVHFGTANPPAFLFSTVSSTYDPPGDMDASTTYYWQIVTRDDRGDETAGPVWSFTTGNGNNQVPTTPQWPSPEDGATGIDVSVTLAWIECTDPDGDAVTYDIYVGTSDPPTYVLNTSATSYDPPGDLEFDTLYYWQIVANDGRGGLTLGSVWTFTTESVANEPPTIPVNPLPSNGSSNIDVLIGLAWTASTDPESDPVVYDLYLGTSNPPALEASDRSATTYNPPGVFEYDTIYFWQVVAKDDQGGETPGALWTFTTASEPNNPPTAPDPVSPAQAAVDQPLSTFVTWSTATDPDSDPVTYEVYFGTANPPPYVATLPGTTYDPPGDLDYSTTYRWRAKAIDGRGGETWGDQRSFTTIAEPNEPPTAPDPLSPAHAATDQPVTTAVVWQQSTDADGDDIEYEIYFGTANPPPLVATVTDTTYDPPGSLDYSTTYRWRARAVDDRGASTWGDQTSFTTEADPNQPPTVPSGPDPADGATDIATAATLSWTASTDPDTDPVTYDVYFGTVSPPPLASADQSATTYDPGGMANADTFYWKIVAKDDRGGETTGPEWEFTTVP